MRCDLRVRIGQRCTAWISRTLCEQEYWKQGKESKGLMHRYVQKMTGLSRAQVTRLIAGYIKTGAVKERIYRRN
jgi:predicted DNA-binding transcriptional regulator AlpA